MTESPSALLERAAALIEQRAAHPAVVFARTVLGES